MLKKQLPCLLILFVFLFNGCAESPSGVSISEEEYALFQSLKEEKEFITSYDYCEIQVLSWKFAKACLSNDTDTMSKLSDLSATDIEISTTMDIFDTNLEFLIVKAIWQSNEKIYVSCEFQKKEEDSYTYLTLTVSNIDGEWKVTSYGFEK